MLPTGVLPSADSVERKRRINSDYELSFQLPMISDDYREKVVQKGHVRDERGQFYVINSRSRVRGGKNITASILCQHIMFKLNDFKFPYTSYIDEAFGVPVITLTNAITAATGGKFTFLTHDVTDLKDVKDFGQGTCLEALNKLVSLY
ncbi:MAG: phage tail protein, partial [Gorillibacterium sp.]|nr:phage tail protein [Gorillibacterium sp.]